MTVEQKAEEILENSWNEGIVKQLEIIQKACMSLGRVGVEKDEIENIIQAFKSDKISSEDAIAAANEIYAKKQTQGSM